MSIVSFGLVWLALGGGAAVVVVAGGGATTTAAVTLGAALAVGAAVVVEITVVCTAAGRACAFGGAFGKSNVSDTIGLSNDTSWTSVS